jgi:hypothetical protein
MSLEVMTVEEIDEVSGAIGLVLLMRQEPVGRL